jgi:hypothetical protein
MNASEAGISPEQSENHKPLQTGGPEFRQHLSSEANTSVALANLLVTIGVAITGYLLQIAKGDLEIPILFSVILVFASFFSSIFYANVTGIIRHSHEKIALQPMLLGNATTEYFGLYIMVALIPLTIFGVSNNKPLSTVASGATFIMFALYHVAGHDMLSRTFPSRSARAALVGIYIFLCIMNMVAGIYLSLFYRYSVAFTTIAFLVYLAVQDLRRSGFYTK